ncbi:MAG: DUF1080 domain-containing protein [Calditrichae bacterium]|nr:DUF1080 domain-containing protein [Calditrichia bacterium]
MKILIFLLVLVLLSCAEKKQSENEVQQQQKINLISNDSFDQWDFVLSDSSVDAQTIWTLKDSIVHCSGAVNGYMRTKEKFSNYILNIDWRWPDEPGNSGVLLHITGPDKVWPLCIEAQLMSGNAGDFYLIGGSTMREQEDPSSNRVQKQNESSERPAGEWNHYKIVVADSTITVFINDIKQNSASATSLQKGMIGLQSEGKPIEFKNIFLEPLN